MKKSPSPSRTQSTTATTLTNDQLSKVSAGAVQGGGLVDKPTFGSLAASGMQDISSTEREITDKM